MENNVVLNKEALDNVTGGVRGRGVMSLSEEAKRAIAMKKIAEFNKRMRAEALAALAAQAEEAASVEPEPVE